MGCKQGSGAFPWFCGGGGGEGEGLSPWRPGSVRVGPLGCELEWVGVAAGPAWGTREAWGLSFLCFCPPGHRQNGPAPQPGRRIVPRWVGMAGCQGLGSRPVTAVPDSHVGGEGN